MKTLDEKDVKNFLIFEKELNLNQIKYKNQKVQLMAVCDNIKNNPYKIERGQRLFQLVAVDSSPISFEIVEELTETTRGKGGFGSTGK